MLELCEAFGPFSIRVPVTEKCMLIFKSEKNEIKIFVDILKLFFVSFDGRRRISAHYYKNYSVQLWHKLFGKTCKFQEK
jgi:hypothetical protein